MHELWDIAWYAALNLYCRVAAHEWLNIAHTSDRMCTRCLVYEVRRG